MSIKSDRWIRQMVTDHNMIEPFEHDQIRTVDGERVISYGTSSYGYDVRCAADFKVFTNINSAVVDPKQFDESSFVDKRSDVCIIPPQKTSGHTKNLRRHNTVLRIGSKCSCTGVYTALSRQFLPCLALA